MSQFTLSNTQFKEFAKPWGNLRIKLRGRYHPNWDKVRLTKQAHNTIGKSSHGIVDFIDGQNREVLGDLGLCYLPLVILRHHTPNHIGAIVTEPEALAILSKNTSKPKGKGKPPKPNIQQLEGKEYLYREGIWIDISRLSSD